MRLCGHSDNENPILDLKNLCLLKMIKPNFSDCLAAVCWPMSANFRLIARILTNKAHCYNSFVKKKYIYINNFTHLSIFHNAPFGTEMCTSWFWMVYLEIQERYIAGFVRLAYSQGLITIPVCDSVSCLSIDLEIALELYFQDPYWPTGIGGSIFNYV